MTNILNIMHKKTLMIILFTFCLLGCNDSKTNNGADFLGIWEGQDSLRIKIEITEMVRNKQKIKDIFELKILTTGDFQENYISEGQYNYWFVSGNGEHNQHPFKEFLHKNAMTDTIPYFAFNENGDLVRRYKGASDITFKKVTK